MGNLLAVLAHCSGRGYEMIVGDKSHIALYEAGGSAGIGGVFSRIIPTG
jgi:threonine aldolase